jgi:GxxExxY protein
MNTKIKLLKHEPDEYIDRLARLIIGIALEVHKTLGPGYLEALYERAFCYELNLRGITYQQQAQFPVMYKGHKIGESRLDLVIAESVVIEIKSVEALIPFYTAQLISYLKASNYKLGFLINFNVPLLKDGIRRIIYTKPN